MTTLAAFSNVTLTLGDGGYVVVSTNGGMASITAAPISGAAQTSTLGPLPARRTFGPYSEGATVTINNQAGALDYDSFAGNTGVDVAALQALVSGAGFVPATADYAGVMAALQQAIASQFSKAIVFGDALYDLGDKYIPVVSGIEYLGVPPRIEYVQNGWSDRAQTYVGGTRFTTTNNYTFWDGALDAGSTAPIVTAQNVTFAQGSSSLQVTDGTKYFVDQRVLFRESGFGVYADICYFILSVVGNLVTVGIADKLAVVATGSGTLSAALASDRLAGTTSGVRMEDLCGVESRTFLKTGAKNSMGLAYSTLKNLYVTGRTGDMGTLNAWRSVSCTNFIQCDVSSIFTNDGDGQYWGADFPAAAYTPGNTVFTHLFNASNGGTSSAMYQHGITFQAELGACLNQLTIISAQHNTAVGTAEYTTTTGAQTSGQPSISVADSTKFPVGSVARVTAAANGFNPSESFFVVVSAGNAIQLSSYKGGPAKNLSGTAAMTINTLGFPLMEVIGVGKDAGKGRVSFSEFRNLDLEGDCISSLWVQNTEGVNVTVNAAATPTGFSVTGRNWFGTLLAQQVCTSEFDANSRVAQTGWRTSKATFDASITGTGLRYDDRTGAWEFKINQIAQLPDFQANVSADSGPVIRALTPLAIKQAQFNGTKTFGNGSFDSGNIVHDGAGTDTYTLPVITDLTATTSMVGMVWEIINAGSTAMTVTTQSGQLLNNQTGKTSVSVGAGQTLFLRACKTIAPTARLFWQAKLSAVLP